jgi:hypothetical protein
VWAYLKDVLDKLLGGSTDYDSLPAGIWKQSHPDSVRNYRSEERRDTAIDFDRRVRGSHFHVGHLHSRQAFGTPNSFARVLSPSRKLGVALGTWQ